MEDRNSPVNRQSSLRRYKTKLVGDVVEGRNSDRCDIAAII
jgi:hypothetical protein